MNRAPWAPHPDSLDGGVKTAKLDPGLRKMWALLLKAIHTADQQRAAKQEPVT